jgi:hypothetical protein
MPWPGSGSASVAVSGLGFISRTSHSLPTSQVRPSR